MSSISESNNFDKFARLSGNRGIITGGILGGEFFPLLLFRVLSFFLSFFRTPRFLEKRSPRRRKGGKDRKGAGSVRVGAVTADR